jgi:magnesium transporter
MINVYLYDGSIYTRGGAELIQLPLADNAMLWIDIEQESAEAEQRIFDQFGCHPLTIQDARRLRHPPKTEHFSDQSFVLVRELDTEHQGLAFDTLQVASFIGSNFLITRHDNPSPAITSWLASTKLSALSALMARGPMVLFASITNSMGLAYLDLLLDFEPALSEYEDTLLSTQGDSVLRDLIGCKTWLRKLKRLHSYHDRVYSELLTHLKQEHGEERDAIHSATDVYEKFERLNSLSALYYDLAGDLIDGHISLTSHNLNETMRILTVVTAIFVPLGFLAGLYGMNFDNIPELHHPNGYFFLVGFMVIIATSLVAIFKRNKWL